MKNTKQINRMMVPGFFFCFSAQKCAREEKRGRKKKETKKKKKAEKHKTGVF